MNCCLHRCWPKYSRDYPLTSRSCILSPSWRLNLCSTCAKDFLRGRDIQDLEVVMGQHCVGESVWHLRCRLPDAGTSVFILMPHLNTGCCVFIHTPHILRYRLPDAGTIWILTLHSVVSLAVWYSQIQRRRPIYALRYQTHHRLRFCNHKFRFSSFSFLHQPLRHGFGIFEWTEMATRKHGTNHDAEQTEKIIPFIPSETAFR